MNVLRLTTVVGTVLLSIALLLLITHVLTKNFKQKLDDKGMLKMSYVIGYVSIILSGSFVISSITQIVIEIADNLQKIQPGNLHFELIRNVIMVLGVGFTWLIIWFFVAKALTRVIPVKMVEKEETEDDHYGYFLIRGFLMIGLIWSFSSILFVLLRTFVPSIQTPFYR